MNPYNNKFIFHPLSRGELILTDNVWKFMRDFQDGTLTRTLYIKHIIKKISNMYSQIDFLIYEIIAEKLYWNLFDLITHLINIAHTEKIYKNNDKLKSYHKLLKHSLVGKTSLRKVFIHNSKNNTYLYKYKYPNDLDLLLFSIIANRSTYETIMSNPEITLGDIDQLIKEPYNSLIEFDYPFPNLNTVVPLTSTMKERMKNIKLMYYVTNAEANWKKIEGID